MLVDSLNDDGDPAQRLERMKSEFLAAQQRRRTRVPETAAPPDNKDQREPEPVLDGTVTHAPPC